MVHIPKIVYTTVYSYLFKHGCLAFQETHRAEYSEEITYKDEAGEDHKVRNLYLNMIMKSLCSRKFAKDTFAWRHHYYTLTDAGEAFIRTELNLGEDIRPDPFKKAVAERPDYESAFAGNKGRPERREFRGERREGRPERREFRGERKEFGGERRERAPRQAAE